MIVKRIAQTLSQLTILLAPFAASSAFGAQDFKATNCEIFIDKVAAKQVAYHGAFGAILNTEIFLKIDLGQTGPVRKVVFYATKRTANNAGTITSDSGFQEIELNKYFGAEDYFVANLGDLENHWWDSSDSSDRAEFEGAFYVERADGIRLWINPSTEFGSHFLFNEGTADTLSFQNQIYVGGGTFPFGAASLTSVEQVKQTADYNTYWNPRRCR